MAIMIRYGGHITNFVRPSCLGLASLWLKRHALKQDLRILPDLPPGLRLHVGAGQRILDGYENLDGYANEQRPEHFATPVTKFARAEILDAEYEPDSVAEIRCHHMFEHISILDVDRTLQGWNKIMKAGGLLWIEVPDFEGCVRQILRLKDEDAKEIYYRHIMGSQFGPGEFHKNGLTASRLMHLLGNYGFQTKLAYVQWVRRIPVPVTMAYPENLPLPDLTVKAIKVGDPKPEVLSSQSTPVVYRRIYPNAEL